MAFKKIAIFIDGTWNEPTDNTNVWKSKVMVAEKSEKDGMEQVAYYHQGVGTEMFQVVLGGVFAKGLSEYLQEIYQWMMEVYNDGDSVFIFGFSRGAFMGKKRDGQFDSP